MNPFRPLYNRIWKKLTLALLLVTFLPIGYFLYQNLSATRDSIEDRETRLVFQNAITRSKEIETAFKNVLTDVNYLRSSMAIEFLVNVPGRKATGILYWKSLVEKEFYNFLSLRSGYSSVGLLDEFGNEKLVMFKNGGKIVTMPQEKLVNRLTSTYYVEAALQGGYGIAAIPMHSLVSNHTEISSQPLIRFATKMFSRSGKPSGVVYADLDSSKIIEALSRVSFEGRRKAAMVSQNGNYIYNPFKTSGMSQSTLDEGNMRNDYSGQVVAQILSGRTGLITDDPDYIFAFRPIYLQAGNKDFYYVVYDRYPRASFIPAMDKIKKEYLVGLAEALFLCLLVAAAVSYTLTRDLEKLRQGVEQIRQRKLDHRVNIRSADEIESLANAYNMMADFLQEYSQSLENKVEERSTHIKKVERKLMQAEKLAAIGFLAAGVAHEINNPISILITRLELMKKDIEKGKTDMLKKDLEVLHNHSVRIGAIASNLLIFSRSASTDLTDADLNEVAERVLSLIEMPIRKKGITLVRKLEPGLPKASLNVSGIEQVIYNIVHNAFQATDEGGTITVRSGLDNEDKIFLEVRDTGHGIKPDVLSHIFEPFFTTKEVGAGTGLGLAISYGLLKDIGGFINVESEPGAGTVFTIHLVRASKASVLAENTAQKGDTK